MRNKIRVSQNNMNYEICEPLMRNGFGDITYFITLCDGNGREEVEDYSTKLWNPQDQYERFMKGKKNNHERRLWLF